MKSKPTWSRRRAFHRFKVALRPLPKGFSGVGREPRRARRLVPLAHAVGQGTFLPRPACVVRVANQLRGGGGYHRAVARPRGAPEVPRRAQRAQHASPEKPGACPAYRRRTGQGRACRLRSARKRRVGRARWGDVGRHAGHGAGGWARKEARKSCKISKCPGLRRSPWQWHEPAGPKGDRNDAHASSEGRASNRDGSPSCPLTLRPHDGRQKPHDQSQSRAPAALASFWLCRGG